MPTFRYNLMIFGVLGPAHLVLTAKDQESADLLAKTVLTHNVTATVPERADGPYDLGGDDDAEQLIKDEINYQNLNKAKRIDPETIRVSGKDYSNAEFTDTFKVPSKEIK